MYTVYIHTNTFNNKKYIGITSLPPEKRWKEGKGYKNQPRFYNAIKKYGWDNFSHKILFSNLSEEEALLEEEKLIKHFKTTNSSFGYNVAEKGNICKGSNLIWINNGDKECKILKDSILPEGYQKGRIKGKRIYNNGVIEKKFFEGQEPKGWIKGSLNKNTLGKKVITDGKTHRFIKPNEKIPEGWSLGASPSMKNNKTTVIITSGETEIYITKKLEDPSVLEKGWYIMKKETFLQLRDKKLKYITNGKSNFLVDENLKTPKGWFEGKCLKQKRSSKGIIINIINSQGYILKLNLNDYNISDINIEQINKIIPEDWRILENSDLINYYNDIQISNKNGITGKICINNGVVNKYINIDEEIPEGWTKGPHSFKKSSRKRTGKGKLLWEKWRELNDLIVKTEFNLYKESCEKENKLPISYNSFRKNYKELICNEISNTYQINIKNINKNNFYKLIRKKFLIEKAKKLNINVDPLLIEALSNDLNKPI